MADKSARLEGALPLARFERLSAALADPQGEARFRLAFRHLGAGRYRVSGELDADLTLQCQRCLNPFAARIESRFELAMVESEEAAERALEQDALESVIVNEQSLSVVELLEDELLLALPAIPRHPEDAADCHPPTFTQTETVTETPAKANPFASLASIKKH
ncbi:MAG: DUF177 domain-containing protein [Thiotrichales bacterium]